MLSTEALTSSERKIYTSTWISMWVFPHVELNYLSSCHRYQEKKDGELKALISCI